MGNETTSYKSILRLIVVLLILALFTQVFQIYSTFQQNGIAKGRAENYQARVLAVQSLVDSQRDQIFNLVSDYNEAAYSANLDRIAEQQLRAAEFQLLGLQILAIQNSQVIELLSEAP